MQRKFALCLKFLYDETNYSLNIELDTILAGKTYHPDKFIARLAFWHYGPGGTVIKSKKTSGSITIIQDDSIKTSGTLALKFKNTDKSEFAIDGTFELPKIKLTDITDLENQIRLKLIKYSDE